MAKKERKVQFVKGNVEEIVVENGVKQKKTKNGAAAIPSKIIIQESKELDINNADDLKSAREMYHKRLFEIVGKVKELKMEAEEIKEILKQL